jgi:ATP-dependent DNA helicase RecG
MAVKNPASLLERLCDYDESDWLEFKVNNVHPNEIGTAISALANSAMLQDRDKAYIVFGVEDKTRKRIGTEKRISSLKVGNEDFINWISRVLEPRLMIEYLDFEVNGIDFSVIVIEPTYDRPVKFNGCEYLRIGANVKKLAEYAAHHLESQPIITPERLLERTKPLLRNWRFRLRVFLPIFGRLPS